MSKRNQRKRRKNRRNKDSSEDESDDNMSATSSVVSFVQEVDPEFTTRHIEDMEDCLEPLTGKRSMISGAERSQAHVLMTSLMCKGVWHEWCAKNEHVLRQIYTDSLKRGDNSERIKALQSCCCTIITLGDELSFSFNSALSDSILFLIRSHINVLRYDFEGAKTWGASSSGKAGKLDLHPEEKNDVLRMVGLAMNILPLLGFTSDSYNSRKQTSNFLFDIWSNATYYASVRVSALEGWVIAVCKMKMKDKGSVLFNQAIPHLIEIIEEEPSAEMSELFTTAGSAIALLYEAHFVMQYEDRPNSNEVNDDDDEEEGNFKYTGRDDIDTDYVKSLLEGLSTQSSKGHKKDTVKAQRRDFRLFVNALDESSNSPSVDIKLKKQEFKLEGWASMIIWDYMKRNLAGGLQAHLLGNSWLHNIFGIDGSSLQVSVVRSKYEKEDQMAERKIYRKELYLKIKKARGLKYRIPNHDY